MTTPPEVNARCRKVFTSSGQRYRCDLPWTHKGKCGSSERSMEDRVLEATSGMLTDREVASFSDLALDTCLYLIGAR